MTQTDTDSTTQTHDAHGGHGDHDHPPHLEHHFDTPQQQYESAKLGMWIFLATEILMFGGLFCAYAIYRGNHEEIYLYSHHYLNTTWGAINTVILLASSFTMAWGVRAAQLGQQKLLVVMLVLTLLGGCGFMIIKGIEYYEKYDIAGVEATLMPGTTNLFYPADRNPVFRGADDPEQAQLEQVRNLEVYYGLRPDADAPAADNDALADAVTGVLEDEAVDAAVAGPAYLFEDLPELKQQRTHLFFQAYYMMTGLHGIHVLIGMGLIAYLVWKAVVGAFSPAYYTPVDIIGLYWHLVDLIWIFLFPLLYLIH